MARDTKPFDIRMDAAQGLVTVELRCFWDIATAEKFQVALRRTIIDAAKGGAIRLLVDGRGFPVQSQDIVGRLEDLSPDVFPALHRVAIVTSATLVRLQVARFSVIDRRQIFADNAAALTWLFSDDET